MRDILRVENISKTYKIRTAFSYVKGYVEALKNISFNIKEAQTLTLIGESGSGKSTLALIVAGLLKPDKGSLFFEDKNLLSFYKEAKTARRMIQIIFQDPYNTLNPRFRVYDTLKDVLQIHRIVPSKKRKDEIVKTLESVGLSSDYIYKYPRQLSGGERQRVAIARAIILKPHLLICDEPTSNLDLSIQAQILNLLLKIKKDNNLTLLFITHDINIASFISDRIIVLYRGRIVEQGSKEEILFNPQADYTRSLLEASILNSD